MATLADAAPPDDAASPTDAGTPAPKETSADPAPTGEFPVYCFSWVHLRDFSTDCFRSRAQCDTAQRQFAVGNRDTRTCERRVHATCTRVTRDGTERCFGDFDNCIRFRKHLAHLGTETSHCINR